MHLTPLTITTNRRFSTICTEVDGMKRALFKVILPALAIGIWVLTCYPVCNKAEGFDFFLFWILVGVPFGIRKMCMVLIPKNFGIAGSMGVLALNAVVGGLIGGVVLIIKVVGMAVELVKIIAGHFWTQCPEV